MVLLICRRCICDVAVGIAWTGTSRTNENMRRRQLEPSQSSTAGIPAKLKLSQLRRHAWGKDWDEQCCRLLLFSYRNSIPGSTGGHVAGASAAYDNQALFSCGLHLSCQTGNCCGNKTDTMSVRILIIFIQSVTFP